MSLQIHAEVLIDSQADFAKSKQFTRRVVCAKSAALHMIYASIKGASGDEKRREIRAAFWGDAGT